MADPSFQINRARVVEDFRRARRQAVLEQILGRLSGHSAELVSYDEIRKQLSSLARKPPVLREIPLDAIVGSVGRYADFTRSFLPKESVSESRWAGVKLAALGMSGVPPIEVYQIGEVYFVLDGNHRVSVARQLGSTKIEAYVTEFESPLPLSADDKPDDLILKAEYADFLAKTRIDELRPGADLRVTAPGNIQTLIEHIEVHRYYLGLERKEDISTEEAVTSWYDHVYLPVVRVIRQKGALRDFPDRTETDLYLWAAKHRTRLEEELGLEVDAARAAANLPSPGSPGLGRAVSRLGEKILDVVTPGDRDEETRSGVDLFATRPATSREHLFEQVLVPLSGEASGWQALEQAIELARSEESDLHGLHVLPPDQEKEDARVQNVQQEFARRCATAGIEGHFILTSGKIPEEIRVRAPYTDLVVLKLNHPPPLQVRARLSSGIRAILRQCSNPVLTVPQDAVPVNRVLLAYDGSPKAQEALYIATYLAGTWETQLTVISVEENGRSAAETLEQAGAYLESSGVQATFVQGRGPVATEILVTAEERQCDLIVMGSYSHHPVVEIVLGSAVDEVLRSSWIPVLICS